NQVWGRCYTRWNQVEAPVNGGTITDFIDWREFHLDTMTAEAAWRLVMARQHDPLRVHYLHVVPNVMSVFNSVTCVDDFALAQHCDVFAATMNGGPILATQVTSAARGKVCYNVESHINHGCTDLHQRMLDLPDVLKDFLPQIGLGIKGFLFWQYRPEVLGFESPAWGLVNLDGTDRPVTHAVKTFWDKVAPLKDSLLYAYPQEPQVGVWKSRKNEIFHFATQNSLQGLTADVEGYIHALYWNNIPFRVISEQQLAQGDLAGIKLLILPACYYLTSEEAVALDRWVREGGVVLNEAHLGAYNGTTGRHSRVIPGNGLAESWGIREMDSSSSYHLRLAEQQAVTAGVTDDVRKALHDFGVSGGEVFPFSLADGTLAWGAHRYAILEGEHLTAEGSFDGVHPCVGSTPAGAGWVLYCGTNLGQAAAKDAQGLLALLQKALSRAGVLPVCGARATHPGTLHLDYLTSPSGAAYAVLQNRTDVEQTLTLNSAGTWTGIFSSTVWHIEGSGQVTVPGSFIDLFIIQA
ncbi:MAG TPA: beta-galactosidase trimerization domain-containing protein, partial [Anaerolineae bacterium]